MVFGDLKIGDKFVCNGNLWRKKSTRTGQPLFDCHVSHYYFSKIQPVDKKG